jgi:acetyl-CoA decarbonylase/synthase complex subunit gamma
VNQVWEKRSEITPTTRERKLPAVFSVYQLLPKTNCRECGYPTCLAYAADIRNGVISLEKCPLLSKPEYAENREKLIALFSSRD